MRLFSDPSTDIADPWLREAYRLAERGRGTTSPNPLVGCVVVAGGEIVGAGYHERAGGPHAEVVALRSAGDRARSAHVAVTLEPCDHEGRTPPCVAALIEAGVSSVLIGMKDPNPQVKGGGGEALRAAGIRVDLAEEEHVFREQNEAWLLWTATGRPWVQAKIALTLDGRPALGEGTRSRITGRGGARVTSRLRAAADAVLVGAGTLSADGPSLTVRDERGEPLGTQPLRVILSRRTIPDPEVTLFRDGLGRVAVLLGDDVSLEEAASLHTAGVEVMAYPSRQGLRGALATLGREGVVRLLVEPGPRLFCALWDEDLIDELTVLTAGGVGGTGARLLYPDRTGASVAELERKMRPVETGLSSETAVTTWNRIADPLK